MEIYLDRYRRDLPTDNHSRELEEIRRSQREKRSPAHTGDPTSNNGDVRHPYRGYMRIELWGKH